MMGDIFKDAAGSHRLHYFLDAVSDLIGDLAQCTRENATVLQKRCDHDVQDMDQHNPVKDGVRNCSHFTGMRAIRVGAHHRSCQ
jgi:hypothetical protein